jgi:hypothetical protein
MTESAGLVPFRQASCDVLVEVIVKLRPPGQGGADERLLAAPAQVLVREHSGEPA